MKKATLILVLCGLCGLAHAADSDIEWATCVRYWYYNNITNAVPPLDQIVSMYNERGVQRFVWHVPSPPTKVELAGLNAAALAWWADYEKTEAADYDKWTDREKALARLFVKEINKLRALHGLAPYTAAQVKAALKAEM